MLLKTGLVLLALGAASLPLYSHGGYVTPTTILLMLGLMFVGFNASMKAELLSHGSRALYFVYRLSPLVLPLCALCVRLVANRAP